MKKIWREVVGDGAGCKEVFAALRDGLNVQKDMCSGGWLGGLSERGGVLYSGQMCVGITERTPKFRIEVKPPEAGAGYRLIEHDKDVPEIGDQLWIKCDDSWSDRTPSNKGRPFSKTCTYRRLIDGVAKMNLSEMQISFILAVKEEYRSALRKHQSWPADQIHCAAIVAEEAGEVVQAALQSEYEQGDVESISNELIQTAAMCMRMWSNLPNP